MGQCVSVNASKKAYTSGNHDFTTHNEKIEEWDKEDESVKEEKKQLKKFSES